MNEQFELEFDSFRSVLICRAYKKQKFSTYHSFKKTQQFPAGSVQTASGYYMPTN